MNDMNSVLKRLVAIEDELIRLRKQRNYELNNLDETNIPKLRQYSQIISKNQAAVSLVEQKVSDVESSVTLLSQYTSFDNVVVVETSDDKTGWDKTRVYYDKTSNIYYYYDGKQWLATTSPVTAGLDTAIAQIQAKTAENEAEISLVAQSVTQNTQAITGLETLTGQIDGEIKTVKTNLAEVTTKADENETAISLVAKSVTDIETDISGLESANKRLNESIAAIELKADDNAAEIGLISKNVTQNADDIVKLQTAAGNINKELSAVKTNIASVETKADDAAASAELAAQSVTELESEVSGQIKTLTQNVASVKTTANNASASVSAIVTNIGSNGTVTAASIVTKINAAGSSVQIAADHISLKGKTIALTSDSIKITSTNFNVSTAGVVECYAIEINGANSLIDIVSSSSSLPKITVSYSNNLNQFTQMTPNAFYSEYSSSRNATYSSDGFSVVGSYGFINATGNTFGVHCDDTGTDVLYVYASPDSWSSMNQVTVNGNFVVYGAKSCLEQTEHYGGRLMYAYETPTPMYSDFGRGTVAEDGMCVVFIDPLFYECVDNAYDYFVFLQPEGKGEIAVLERTADHFIIKGTPGAVFAWMIATPQKGYSATRCEEFIAAEQQPVKTYNVENNTYDGIGDEILKEFNNQLG